MSEKPKYTGAIKKTVLRNVEVPIDKNKKYVFKATENGSKPIKKPEPRNELPKQRPSTSGDSEKYRKPELNSALGIMKEIQAIKQRKPQAFQDIGQLTPKTKAKVHEKITKSLNQPEDRMSYKNLVPLNVNDTILMSKPQKPMKNRFVPSGTKNPELELEDFLEPIPPFDDDWKPKYTEGPYRPMKFSMIDKILEDLRQIDVDFD